MKSVLFAIAVAFLIPAADAASPTPPQRTLKPEDFAALRDVDEPNISPDGNFIAYVVKTADLEKDKLPGNLWLAKWDGSENRALTFGNKGQSHPRWSPDGKWIAFLSGREDENEVDQLWILPSNGGEAEKFTNLRVQRLPNRRCISKTFSLRTLSYFDDNTGQKINGAV